MDKLERVKAILDRHCWEFEQLKQCSQHSRMYGDQSMRCWGCDRNTKMAEAVIEEAGK